MISSIVSLIKTSRVLPFLGQGLILGAPPPHPSDNLLDLKDASLKINIFELKSDDLANPATTEKLNDRKLMIKSVRAEGAKKLHRLFHRDFSIFLWHLVNDRNLGIK
jgi:hypothetical protein